MKRFWISGLAAVMLTASQGLAYDPKTIDEILDQSVRYDSAIPTPQSVTGYELGEIVYPPDLHRDYIEALDEASDRVSTEVIGYSHFGRPIIRVTITSPENHARLDDILDTQRAQREAGASTPEDHPVIVQLTHGVHGSEPSGYDSALAIMYHMAAAQSDEANALLDDVVLTQIVMINPDGANRFSQWTNLHHANRPVADPEHREHFYEWPWGRTNHYWFDLNRQWLPVTQPEARALVRATHEWMPNIAVDLHEMGRNSTFFFSPGPVDGLHPLLSQDGLELNLEMNGFIENQLDGEGALYVSEEVFDDFYLGYGSSYPGLIGSVPYLFEQSSVRGIIQQTDYGILRYDDKIGQQARVALALIRAAQSHSDDLQSHMRAFFDENRRLAASDPVRAYVFTSSDKGRLADFVEMLGVHEIEIRELGQSVRLNGIDFEPGSAYVVPVRQDQYRIVQGLFETRIVEDKNEFYDVSGWTQPLAWDMDYAVLRSGFFSSGLNGDVVVNIERAAPTPDQASLAYVMEWDSYYAPRALYRMLDAGLQARVIPDETRVMTTQGEVEPGRGAIVVRIQGQSLSANEIHEFMVQAAEEDSVTIHAATSAATPLGSDLGGFSLSNVEKPEVLLITGRGTAMYDAGELWHLLDHEMQMHVSMIDQSELGSVDLGAYTHILMPHGSYNRLGEGMSETFNDWVRNGGVLLAFRNAARWAIDNDLSNASWVSSLEEGANDAEASDPPSYDGINQWDAEVMISGALFNADIDTTHPLAFGYRDSEVAIHKMGADGFAVSDNPFALPVRYVEGDPILSGYASRDNRSKLAGSGMMHAERKGSGSVILFSDNPVFRAYMKGSARLVTNALFFGDDFRNPRRRAD